MARSEHQELLRETFQDRPVAFYPCVARALGSVKAGLLMCQLLYWSDKSWDPDWIYKSAREVTGEICLSKKEQETAVRECRRLGVLDVKYARIPRTRHFRVNMEKLFELLSRTQKVQQGGSKRSAQGRRKMTAITETTSKTSPETTPESNHETPSYRRRRPAPLGEFLDLEEDYPNRQARNLTKLDTFDA